jgi:hypothetical protein
MVMAGGARKMTAKTTMKDTAKTKKRIKNGCR